MIVVGINASHNATVALIKDGKLLACISEERLTGVKNKSGLPVEAFKEVLRITGIKSSEVDKVVFGYSDPKVNMQFSAPDIKGVAISESIPLLIRIKEEILLRIPSSRYWYDAVLTNFYKLFVDSKKLEELLTSVEKKLGVPRTKVSMMDHHLAHAHGPYLGNPQVNNKDWIVLTFDAMGDGQCATVSTVKKGKLKKVASTRSGNSLGDLYGLTTLYFGMKGGEHEYKVMGLAPYANEEHAVGVYKKLKKLIWVNPDMSFSTSIHSHMFYKILPKVYYKERFDNIAHGLQRLTEELLVEWVTLCVKKTGIKNVACGGGIFMNVKANQKILDIPGVESLFIMPSCGDESTAIGAAYFGYEEARAGDSTLPKPEPLKDLYLGTEFTDIEIGKELLRKEYKKLIIKKSQNIEVECAKLLAKGEVVARFSGRMEWGARALGNRSIMAHPSNLDVIRTINDQIKSRDFWMPFAPSILTEKASKYIINSKKMPSPYMIITFDTTPLGKKDFKAAMHQYDFTLRPQLVDKDWNHGYWKVLSEFEKITGIGGILNTSYNLHGFPIVRSPKEAMYVLMNSGLEYLAIGSYLVKKQSA